MNDDGVFERIGQKTCAFLIFVNNFHTLDIVVLFQSGSEVTGNEIAAENDDFFIRRAFHAEVSDCIDNLVGRNQKVYFIAGVDDIAAAGNKAAAAADNADNVDVQFRRQTFQMHQRRLNQRAAVLAAESQQIDLLIGKSQHFGGAGNF